MAIVPLEDANIESTGGGSTDDTKIRRFAEGSQHGGIPQHNRIPIPRQRIPQHVPKITVLEDTLPFSIYEIDQYVDTTNGPHVELRMNTAALAAALGGMEAKVLHVYDDCSDGVPLVFDDELTKRKPARKNAAGVILSGNVQGHVAGEVAVIDDSTRPYGREITRVVPMPTLALTFPILAWIERLLIEKGLQTNAREVMEVMAFRIDSPELACRPAEANCVKLLVKHWEIFQRWYLQDFATRGYNELEMALEQFEGLTHAAALSFLGLVEVSIRQHNSLNLASFTLTF